jgi:arylsulfatase A-like enzyme
MLTEIDTNVGQVLDAVDRAGISENTIVIFTRDNGPEFIRP